MMGTTHLVLGISSALLVSQPKDAIGIAAALIGGSIGGVMADIDVKLDFENKFESRYSWDALGSELVALLLSMSILFVDTKYNKLNIITSVLDNKLMAIIGGIFFVILLIIGFNSKNRHREKTHSLLALILSSLSLILVNKSIGICYAIGYASHLLVDILNKSGMMLFYPFGKKTGICLKLCYADKLANQLFFGLGLSTIAIYIYLFSLNSI